MRVFQSYRKQRQYAPSYKGPRKAGENEITVNQIDNSNVNLYHTIQPKTVSNEWKILPVFNGIASTEDDSTKIQGVDAIQEFKNEIFKFRLNQSVNEKVDLYLALEDLGQNDSQKPKYVCLRFTKFQESQDSIIEKCQVISEDNDISYQTVEYYVDSDVTESLIRLTEEVKYGSKTHGILDFNINLGYWKDVYLTLIDIPFMNQLDVGFTPRRRVYGYFIQKEDI